MATINTYSSISAKTGIGGLVSGMDIDELVKNLSATSRQKLFKQEQTLQKLQWKQTAYRSVSTGLKEFQTNYLDLLSKTNFRSASFFNNVKASTVSKAISVSTTAGSAEGKMVIDKIRQLATNQTVTSGGPVSKEMTLNTLSAAEVQALEGQSLSLTLDGKVKTITFDEEFINNVEDMGFKNALQTSLDKAFGKYTNEAGVEKSYIEVAENGGVLSLKAPGSQLIVNSIGGDQNALEALGLSPGQSNKVTTYTPLMNLNIPGLTPAEDEDGNKYYEFSINGETFKFNETDSLSAVMSKINSNEKAGVTMSYSSITDKFTITAKESGAGQNIQIKDLGGSNLMESFGIINSAGSFQDMKEGKNAILVVNGEEIVRSDNRVEIDGVRIELKETSDEAITIDLKRDGSSLMDPIKKFVDDYNAMMDLMHGLTNEKVNSKYEPLSDEQKAEMSEKEVEKWEAMAKSGLLRGDRTLQDIATKFQTLMSSTFVDGVSLHNIGIESAGYGSNGKLKINEDKLTKALEEKGAEISALFTSEGGIGNKLNEVINGAIKTSGSKGQRGTLVEAAGIESTRSDTENAIYDSIERTNKLIARLKLQLASEESRLWSRFTAMETAISRLNNQSAILTQFSGGTA